MSGTQGSTNRGSTPAVGLGEGTRKVVGTRMMEGQPKKKKREKKRKHNDNSCKNNAEFVRVSMQV